MKSIDSAWLVWSLRQQRHIIQREDRRRRRREALLCAQRDGFVLAWIIIMTWPPSSFMRAAGIVCACLAPAVIGWLLCR